MSIDATVDTREQRRTRNIGISNLLKAQLPWTNPDGDGGGLFCVGRDVSGGRVDVIVIVGCESDEVAAEDVEMEEEKKNEVESDSEVEEASDVGVPTVIVLCPCTMHSRLVLDEQGPGEPGEREEEREVDVGVELILSPREIDIWDTDVPSKADRLLESTEAVFVRSLRIAVFDDNDVVEGPMVMMAEPIFMHSSAQGVASACFHVCEWFPLVSTDVRAAFTAPSVSSTHSKAVFDAQGVAWGVVKSRGRYEFHLLVVDMALALVVEL